MRLQKFLALFFLIGGGILTGLDIVEHRLPFALITVGCGVFFLGP
jgi:hypothetical protein